MTDPNEILIPEFGDSFNDAVEYAADPKRVIADMIGLDELAVLYHDLLVCGRGDLLLPIFIGSRQRWAFLEERSLRLSVKYGE